MKLASKKNMISINGMISMRALLCGTGDESCIFDEIYNEAPVSVKVMGHVTFVAVPGLNRQRLRPLTAASSSTGLPVLFCTVTSVTSPLAGSTRIIITPLPVIRCWRASYGYEGIGRTTASAFARDIDISAALTGTNFGALGGGRGGGVLSSTNSGLMSGGGGGSGNGMSSGGGVDSGGAKVASIICGGGGGRSAGAASCLCDNATAVA